MFPASIEEPGNSGVVCLQSGGIGQFVSRPVYKTLSVQFRTEFEGFHTAGGITAEVQIGYTEFAGLVIRSLLQRQYQPRLPTCGRGVG
ncbi:MAG: hypothetical protein FGM22_10855 [Burkholderiaceae bacterium]|nr:hypothetical protein [Burkholderiaceae bacterium]